MVNRIHFFGFICASVLFIHGCNQAEARPTSTFPATSTPPPPAESIVTEDWSENQEEKSTETEASTITLPGTETPFVSLLDQDSTNGFLLPIRILHLEPEEASFFFELEQPASGALLYKPADEAVGWGLIPLNPDSARQQIVVKNLEPGREYLVQVGLGDAIQGLMIPTFQGKRWGPLHVSLPEEVSTSLRIAVVGDSGFGERKTFELIEQMAEYSPNFVLHTGDVVYKAEEQANPVEAFAKKFFLPFQPILLKAPVYSVVGNHELDAATYWQGSPMYYAVFPPFSASGFESNLDRNRNSWYGFKYGPYQFLMLDTQTFFNEPGRQEQTSWLRSALEVDTELYYTILVTHVPFYSSGPHSQEDVVVRSEWLPLLESARVPLVLSGHDHFYERLVVEDRNYVVTGGGSSVLYNNINPSPFSLSYFKETHFVLLDLSPNSIRARAITSDGEILEDIELRVTSVSR
jgi:hypothetical protein